MRPDGNETYVQNGWLRASHRKLDAAALDRARPGARRTCAATPRRCPAGASALVRVPIFPVAHAFRAGSRIRVTVQAVGGDRPRWAFATRRPRPHPQHGHAGRRAGLAASCCPVLAGATAQGTPLPPATALRGEPSRRYVAASNGG